MLQQTQVDRVLPKYQQWLEKYPTLEALADAPEDDVAAPVAAARLQHPAAAAARHRQGIGRPIWRRAAVRRGHAAVVQGHRRVHGRRGAQLCVRPARGDTRHQRRARALPGVHRPREARSRTPARRHLWTLSRTLLPVRQVFDFNQALMDFGATVCTARKPQVPRLPDARRLRRLSVQSRHTSVSDRRIVVTAAVVERDGAISSRVVCAARTSKGSGSFPAASASPARPTWTCLVREIREELGCDVRRRREAARQRGPRISRAHRRAAFLSLRLDGRAAAAARSGDPLDRPRGAARRSIFRPPTTS